MFRYTYAGIRIVSMEIERGDRHRTRLCVHQEHRDKGIYRICRKRKKPKRGYEYRSEHNPRSACNTGIKKGIEENIHTRHRIIETGKQTRNGREGDLVYYW